MQARSVSLTGSFSITSKVQDYVQLTKFRLSTLVVFSALMGYLIATGSSFSWAPLILLAVGGFLVTASSNAFNQIIERDTDKLMDRTANRPLPAGRMGLTEAYLVAFITGVGGLLILWHGINPLCAVLSLISILLYTIVYTPAKRITPFSVLIGAFPGAFPPLLGWVAATNNVGMEAFVLYAIQFIWQFPHFWAIAWVLHDDYQKAGFKMLPGQGRTKASAFQTLVYTASLVPLGFVPQFFGYVNSITTLLIVLTGVLFTAQAAKLYVTCEMKAAQKLMFGSFVYLPLIQLFWMLNELL